MKIELTKSLTTDAIKLAKEIVVIDEMFYECGLKGERKQILVWNEQIKKVNVSGYVDKIDDIVNGKIIMKRHAIDTLFTISSAKNLIDISLKLLKKNEQVNYHGGKFSKPVSVWYEGTINPYEYMSAVQKMREMKVNDTFSGVIRHPITVKDICKPKEITITTSYRLRNGIFRNVDEILRINKDKTIDYFSAMFDEEKRMFGINRDEFMLLTLDDAVDIVNEALEVGKKWMKRSDFKKRVSYIGAKTSI